jgi:hypothetical protein
MVDRRISDNTIHTEKFYSVTHKEVLSLHDLVLPYLDFIFGGLENLIIPCSSFRFWAHLQQISEACKNLIIKELSTMDYMNCGGNRDLYLASSLEKKKFTTKKVYFGSLPSFSLPFLLALLSFFSLLLPCPYPFSFEEAFSALSRTLNSIKSRLSAIESAGQQTPLSAAHTPSCFGYSMTLVAQDLHDHILSKLPDQDKFKNCTPATRSYSHFLLHHSITLPSLKGKTL